MFEIRRILILISVQLLSVCLLAQVNATDIVITERGKNFDEARSNAFKKAISQIFFAYVSSNTVVVNDSIVKDETFLSSFGKIENSNILSKYVDTLNGDHVVTLKINYSPEDLLKIIKSKGYSVAIDGQSIANKFIQEKEINDRNERLLKLNISNEINAINSSIEALKLNVLKCYDYQIKNITSPQRLGDKWSIPLEIKISVNDDFFKLQQEIYNVLKINSINKEVLDKEFFKKRIKVYGVAYCNSKNESDDFYFRSNETVSKIIELILSFNSSVQNFTIENGVKSITIKQLSDINEGDIRIFDGNFSIFLDLRNDKNFYGGSFFHDGIRSKISDYQSKIAQFAGVTEYDIDYTHPILDWRELINSKDNFYLDYKTYNLLKVNKEFFYNTSFLKKSKFDNLIFNCEKVFIVSFSKITKKTEIIVNANDILSENELSKVKAYYIKK